MLKIIHRYTRAIQALLLLAGVACAVPIQAAGYNYTVIDYPGAIFTQVFGINDSGMIVGFASLDNPSPAISFVYDSKKQVFTILPNVPGKFSTQAQGINESGAVSGNAGDGVFNIGFILEAGAFTVLPTRGWPYTEARAIGTTGLVTGFSSDNAGHTVGFIYNPDDRSFIDILPSPRTFAQGINSSGQVVGSVRLDAGGAYPGSPAGHYGFLRARSAAIQLFEVKRGVNTRARGITNWGRITGFFEDPVTGTTRGYVASLAPVPGFQSLTVPDEDLLDVPGAVVTTPEGIEDSGRIAGIWNDAGGLAHGFLAAPLPSEGAK